MTIFWSKLTSDLALHPARMLLLGIAILIGTLTVTAAFVARDVLTREITASFARSLPPSAVIFLDEVSPEVLSALSGDPAVETVEPRRQLRGRVETKDGSFASLRLTLVPSLAVQSVSAFGVSDNIDLGQVGDVLVERSSQAVLGLSVGDLLTMRFPGRVEARVKFSGLVRDGAVAPGIQDRIVYAYATPAQLIGLGLPPTFNEAHIRFVPGTQDPAAALTRLAERLATLNLTPVRVELSAQQHPHADQMQAVLVLLGVFALFGAAVAMSLTGNLVAAALRAEQRIIGIMRALGASRARVTASTVTGVALVAIPAASLGLGVGTLLARYLTGFVAHELNLIDVPLTAGWAPYGAASGLGLGPPLLVAATCAWLATRSATLDAIEPERAGSVGAATAFNRSGGAGSIAVAYAFRNLGRRPIRLALTLAALTLGGVALLSASNAYSSLVAAVERAFVARTDDLDVRLLVPVDKSRLISAAQQVAGVTSVEAWGGLLVSIADPENTISGSRFGLLAPSADTALLKLPIAKGRWLSNGLEIVASRNLLAKEPRLQLGQNVTLAVGTRRIEVRLVGIVEEATEPGIYATTAVYDQLIDKSGTAGALRIVTSQDPETVARRLDGVLFSEGAVPALLFDKAELRFATTEHFVILLLLLGSVATAALLVGGLSLSSSIAIAIVERAREIGVLRAIGSSNATVLLLFAREAFAVTIISLGLAMVLAIPLSAAIGMALGKHALHINVPLVISGTGLAIWITSALVIAALATIVPVVRQLRLPVRDSLAYE